MMRGEAASLRRNQQIAPRRRLDLPDFLEMSGPRLSRNQQELQRALPILVQFIWHQTVQRFPADAARDHVVDQACQIGGQCERRSRAADHQRRQYRTFCPGSDQFRQGESALEFTEAWGNLQRRRAG